MLDVVLLLFVLCPLVHLVLGTRFHVGGVVAAIKVECLAHCQVVDLGAHAVEEVGRVGGEDEDRVPPRQVVLQPDARAQVEVVGRLIQHEEHRPYEERLRQSHAHPPAAGHVLGGTLHHRLGEAEAVQQLACGQMKSLGSLPNRPLRGGRGKIHSHNPKAS